MQTIPTQIEESSIRIEVATVVEEFAVDTTTTVAMVTGNKLVIKVRPVLVK